MEEEVHLGRLLEQAYRSFSDQARQQEISYRRSFDVEPVIVTDGDRVLQIVSNLLENAFQWTPAGGAISLGLAADNGSVSISVADTGPGIPLDEQERIFRPFWSRNNAGTGLGLAISRQLAHALGGELALESQAGRGARFELRLPT
jgi:signal transduction histidine kinase